MRHRRRADANQPEIVSALRQAGCSVEVLSDVGRGVPDLLVGIHNRTYLLEVKSPQEKCSTAEANWHHNWRGYPVAIVRNQDEALFAVGMIKSLFINEKVS